MSVCSANLCEGAEFRSDSFIFSTFCGGAASTVCVCGGGGVTLHWLTRNEGVSNSRVNTEGTILIYDIVTVCINLVHTDYNKVEPMMCHSSHLGYVSLNRFIQCM